MSLAALDVWTTAWRRAALLALTALLPATTWPAGAAKAGAPDADEVTLNQAIEHCLGLPVAATDNQPALRLAMATVSAGGSPMLSGIFGRVLPSGASEQMPGKGAIIAPQSPAAQLLFDGSSDVMAGRHGEAEKKLGDCIRLSAKEGDSLNLAACHNNLGMVHAAKGQHGQARSSFEQALTHYRTVRMPPANPPVPPSAQATVLNLLATAQGGLANLPPEMRAQIAAAFAEQAPKTNELMKEQAIRMWKMVDQVNTLRGIERTTLNLGNLALVTGRLADAQALLQQALDSHPPSDPTACKAAAAADLARLHRRLGRTAESQQLLARFPAPLPSKDDRPLGALELGGITLAAAGTAQPDSAVPARAAAPEPTPAARMLAEPSGRFTDIALTQLLAQANSENATQRPAQALQNWQRLALRADAGQRPDLAFAAHAALLRLHAARGDTTLAVLHGKRAANLAQAARANMSDASPSRDARRAYLRERQQVYVTLAQLLMDQQRLIEAEATLQLLKEDEGQQFISAASGTPLGRLALSASELAVQKHDDEAVRQLLAADQARLTAGSSLPIGSAALLMLPPAQIEELRLKQGLALNLVPALLKRKRLSVPQGASLAMLQSFFLGTDRRLQRFMDDLVADARQFATPPSTAQWAQLNENLKNLAKIQAELVPLLRESNTEPAPAFTVSSGFGGGRPYGPDEVDPWAYVSAEPLRTMWRSMRSVDEIESRHLLAAQPQTATLASAARPAAGGSAPDETRSLLAQQALPTALLYYLPGNDRLDVLLVSATDRQHWRLPVARADLDARIDQFVRQLQRSGNDPRPAARAMHDSLFAPIRPALAERGVKVLALSLAGKLRFVPFAALHDGEDWLVGRYAFALHPGGPLNGRLKPASANWRAAAFGATLGSADFRPLAHVRSEIGSVVRQPSSAAGALPGEAWLDQSFTAQKLRSALSGNAQVLHIASHFKFVGGDAAASFLLLGDGGRLSLQELASPQYRFDKTELVTLSACATGLSADDTYGQEVDGLAALLMGQGAPSVLASMWEVDDSSTATLMGSLYRLRERGNLSRALALQQAQLAMIRAAAPAPAGNAPLRSGERVRLPEEAEFNDKAAGNAPASLGRAHPFHWAPFVLMGNWL